jgi:hypothetical protein
LGQRQLVGGAAAPPYRGDGRPPGLLYRGGEWFDRFWCLWQFQWWSARRFVGRVKAGSGVFAEFRGLRLTEPRSVAGRGSGFQGVSEGNMGTGWGKDK